MKTNTYLLLLFSAICYACAFICSQWSKLCTLTILISYGILFFLGIRQTISFSMGLLWGLIAFGLHLASLVPLFIASAHGRWRLLAWALLVLFTALHSAIWLSSTTWLARRRNIKHDNRALLLWPLSTCLFTLWLDSYFLWIFGLWEGYCCFHPLLPLIVFYPVRTLISSMGLLGASFLLFFVCAWGALAAHNLNANMRDVYRSYSIIAISLLLVLYKSSSLALFKYINAPSWLNKYVWAATTFDPRGLKSADCYGQEIYYALKCVRERYSDIHVIIMPESAFPYALNNYPEIIDLWRELLDPGVTLILGAHRKEQTCIFNTCYAITQQGIEKYYDKQHGLFFTERIPAWCTRYSSLRNLFLKNKMVFSQSKENIKSCWYYGTRLVIYICSELFFSHKKPEYNSTLLCLVNDAWYKHSWLPHILYSAAKLKALAWSCNIIYISHSRGVFIDNKGQEYSINNI